MFLIALILVLPEFSKQERPVRSCMKGPLVEQVAPAYSLNEILDALRVTESGGQRNGGRDAAGDGGRAIGPYQIHLPYFLDSRTAGLYGDCRDPDYARHVVVAYWKRWCPDALERLDVEVLIRVHNGGPRGARKPSTLAFWRKVESRLVIARTRSL